MIPTIANCRNRHDVKAELRTDNNLDKSDYENRMCQKEAPKSVEVRFMNNRPQNGQAYIPTDCEHIANVVTHGMWVLPSLAGLLWMMHLSSGHLQLFITFIYGLSLFALFTISTAFHALSYCGGQFQKLRSWFHFGDRAVIYIFIAASYTPWLILREFNTACLYVLLIVWIGATLGIAYQYMFHERYKLLEIVFYLAIGIAPSIVVVKMNDTTGLHEVALGGAVYIAGVIFFRCDGVIPFAHAIWHCFVILGAVLHFHAICNYLLVPGPYLSDMLCMSFFS